MPQAAAKGRRVVKIHGKAYTLRVVLVSGEAVRLSNPLCAPDEPKFLSSFDDVLTTAMHSHCRNSMIQENT
ncbi:MAG: hypothetical protein ABI191_02495 [Rhizomicrobium sp.]